LFPEVRPQLIDVSVSRLGEWAAGGMLATASDLARFAVALRDGALLKPESLRFMMDWYPAESGREVGHGLFRTTRHDGTRLIGHTGGVLGFSADLEWLEGGDAVTVSLTNVGTMDAGELPLKAPQGDSFYSLALLFAREAEASECASKNSRNSMK
jgi:D-alanyl-D-alanine carboxypeptidase